VSAEQLPETTEPSTSDARAPRWSSRKTIAAVAVAVGVAGAGGVAIWAAGGSAATTTTATGQVPGGPGGRPGDAESWRAGSGKCAGWSRKSSWLANQQPETIADEQGA
jgi:hypothetical protein